MVRCSIFFVLADGSKLGDAGSGDGGLRERGRNHDELKVVLVIQAFHFTGRLGFRQVVFEGDSKLQIAALNSADVSWTPGSAGHLLDEAKMMALQFLSTEFH
ncbi:hypothetical protein SO802_009538 [Lithocarpus litseifolius]|uniref:RNase H type-1 domain-containing protein n=1 Tax=Lithocarpus litseifolius TaxID=425828 RepID=A0AAW2DCB5_9ROSI